MALKPFLADIRGNFAITFAICAIPVMLAAGMALDFTQVANHRSRLQAAVDAAALAVAQDMATLDDAGVERMVDDFLEANLDAADYARLAGTDVQIDRPAGSLTIVADGSMPTSFTRLAGHETLDYRVAASIRASFGELEAVLVLDNTGSMARNGKMADLKRAARQFVADMLERDNGAGAVRIGLVPFSNYVNVGTANRGASWITVPTDRGPSRWFGCVGSREYPLNLSDSDFSTRVPGVMGVQCAAEVLPLTSSEATLDNAIQRMQPVGLTYIPAGVAWGVRTLSPEAPFTGGATEDEVRERSIVKALVVMTDGENTISKDSGAPTHDSRDLDEANRWTLEACAAAKAQNIKVYTMTFGTEVPPAAAQLMQDCSSGAGFFFDASNGAELSRAFSEIALSLSKLYLSQ